MKKHLFLIVVSVLLVCLAYTLAAPSAHVMVKPDQLKWAPGGPDMPPGAQVAVLSGDPSKAGMYTMRIKAPDGYKVAPHWHPADEHLTVIQGKFGVSTGDKFEAKGEELGSGSYVLMPARAHHFAWTKGETIVQVSGMGPFKIIYVNPADNPNKAAKPTKPKTKTAG